jgi:cyclase
MTFTKGLVEIADGVHAYIQPDGSWGLSNAGLAMGAGASTLIDTLFDLKLTQEMRSNPISTLVNTHANGDHCFGNQLVAGPTVSIYASVAAAEEMDEAPPSRIVELIRNSPAGAEADFANHAFGAFDFDGIEVPPTTHTFQGRTTLAVGGKTIELIEVGPAHTAGDILAWLPEERVMFTGDILFIGGTPIMWAGPISNWIAACDLIRDLGAEVVVPGHGPLTDGAGANEVGEYLRFVQGGVRERHAAGMTPLQASRDLDLELNGTRFGSWGDRERLVVTVHSVWRELDPGATQPGINELFTMMAQDFAALHA